MSSRWHRYLTEASRFLAVGGLATLVALVLFNLLVHGFSTGDHALLDDRPILAYVIANTLSMGISYHGSRTWAFRDRPPRHADGGLTAYVAINLATMVLPIACLTFSRRVLGLDDPVSDNISANVVGLALGTAARFYLFRTFVFKRPLSLTDLYLPPEEAEPDGEGRALPGGPVGGVTGVGEQSRGPSRSGPAPPPAP